MVKIAIVYASMHHNNTKKLVEGIALKCNVDTFNVLETNKIDLSSYDVIGFASGIYYSTFHKALFNFVENHQLPNKVFLMYTSGVINKKYANSFKQILEMKKINVIGTFNCKGYDTYGILRFIGGISRNHPSSKDISNGIDFVNNLFH